MPTLRWLSRDEDVLAAREVPFRVLSEVSELSYGDKDSGNMLIEGDNLDALKSLLPFYAGSVKCIYIDPPYNTKSAWDHYDDSLEHSRWLAMMWPRLELLRELLAEDGSIWVSIDDRECHYLKVLMDEVFGRTNFVGSIVWRKNYAPKSSAKHFSEDHDYILVYSSDARTWRPNPLPRSEKQNKAYKNLDNDPRGPWRPNNLAARNFYSKGSYPITCPGGRIIDGPPPGSYWRVSPERFAELDADNRIWWGNDGNNVPAPKIFLSEVKQGVTPQTFWSYEDVGHTQEAKKEMVALNSVDVFTTPKPERLMERIVRLATNPGDIVLDSFVGSGTTAAVAQKLGRKFIGIEMGAHAQTHCQPRLRGVTDGDDIGISAEVGWKGGAGFRYYELGAPVFEDDGSIRPDIKYADLGAHIWFSEFRSPRSKSNEGPLLGTTDGTALALLYNGILGDKSVSGGNVLNRTTLALIRKHLPEGFDGDLIVYGERTVLSERTLKRENITFKQTPYDVKARA